MAVETAEPRSRAWKWVALTSAVGVIVKIVLDRLWPYSSKPGLELRWAYDLADCLLVPQNLVWLIWNRLTRTGFPPVFDDLFLSAVIQAGVYGLFGYLLWWSIQRGWRGYAVFGFVVTALWAALLGSAILVGVTTQHADGVYQRVVPRKLSNDLVQKIQNESVSVDELMGLAGNSDCRFEKEGRQIFVYRALTQRRHVNYLFFITTKVGYVTRERLDFVRSENGAIVQHMDSTEIYEGKAEDLAFDCGSLALE